MEDSIQNKDIPSPPVVVVATVTPEPETTLQIDDKCEEKIEDNLDTNLTTESKLVDNDTDNVVCDDEQQLESKDATATTSATIEEQHTETIECSVDDKKQDIVVEDEESANDIQSVFNKITESLKTINQDVNTSDEQDDNENNNSDNLEELESQQSQVAAPAIDDDDKCQPSNEIGSKKTVTSILIEESNSSSQDQLVNIEANQSLLVAEKNDNVKLTSTSDMIETNVAYRMDSPDNCNVDVFMELMDTEEISTASTEERSPLTDDLTENLDKNKSPASKDIDDDSSEIATCAENNLVTDSLHKENIIVEPISIVATQPITPSTNNKLNDENVNTENLTSNNNQMDYEDDDVIEITEPTTIIDLDADEFNDDENLPETDHKMEIDKNVVVKSSTTDDKNITTPSKNMITENKLGKNEIVNDRYVFFNKECINIACPLTSKHFFKAPMFALSFFKVCVKPNKNQFICETCYDESILNYEKWCNIIEDGQPLLLAHIPEIKSEFVEILDSSDEEETDTVNTNESAGDFPESTADLLQNELDNIICNVLGRVNIQNQLTWSKTILQHRIQKLNQDSDTITETLKDLQKKCDNMNNTLYQCPKIEMRVLTPLDLNTGKSYILGDTAQSAELMVPPLGEIKYPKIELKGLYFAAKNKVMASWLPCKVVEIIDGPGIQHFKSVQFYKIKFLKTKVVILKSVPAKHMAYNEAPTVQLAIGTRVIALFDATTLSKGKDKLSEVKSAFYPGIIAEALQSYNQFRYLIFFDDGYTQYVQHRDVRLICEASVNVWEDIHPGSREFIQNYLINYKKNRPMVQVKKGQTMITELNGKWIYAKVIDADASLINMLFEGQKNHTEWIYRGSTRLGPLFKAIQKTNIPAVTRLPRRSEPYVRYMQDDDDLLRRETATKSTTTVNLYSGPPQQAPVRSVAKKSTSKIQDIIVTTSPGGSAAPVKHLNNSTIFVDDEEPKGKLVYYSAKIDSNPPPKPYIPHKCNVLCITRKISLGHNYGVLSKPLLNGWERAIYKVKQKKSAVTYTAPCGRRVRNMEELHRYLRLTKNALNVENFVFDPECGCLTEYQVQKCMVNKYDITEGREQMPIQCVNYYDHTMPPPCIYSADRIPTEGVNINTEADFLVGCDCDGDCSDKSKCSCWQLTLEGAKYGNAHTPMESVGYYYKRLPEPVPTGIYECNSRCKCSKQCINRVVQHPLDTKLQVFKTSNRGWGLRCINDVPKGSFICIYAGDLLTEQNANEGGANSGDEYFAELDYIEVAERLKEGYESDVQDNFNSDDDDEQYVPENDSDEEFRPPKTVDKNVSHNNSRIRPRKSPKVDGNDEEDEQERQAINFEPNTSLANYDEENSATKYRSMRKLYGKNEYCYIMDAKNIGNVGRYFNHSCSPNLFVQNVFVDTHDLRFPWVAFFALSQIRAGTELTWNYNYEVGVVPGKVLYCECGAPNCRGRLL